MSKLRAAIYGFAVGDALGVPYEFMSREAIEYHPATGMTGYGTHQQAPGTWSDDTSFMLCALENILDNGTPQTLKNKMQQCYREGYLTPNGKLFDIGIATLSALDDNIRAKKKQEILKQGNGSLMRSLPYAFLKIFNKSIAQMLLDHSITHDDVLCHLCSLFYVHMAKSLIEGDTPEKAMQKATTYLKKELKSIKKDEYKIYQEALKRIINTPFAKLPEHAISSSGYVVSTLEAVCWCFLNTNSYRDAVLKAVNLGDDTDTIAALTGGLAGIHYGASAIPEQWLKTLKNKPLIESLLSRTD